MRAKNKLKDFVKAHPRISFLLLLVILTLLCILGSVLIDTDGEKVVRAISQTQEGLEAGDLDRTMQNVSPDFSQEGMDRIALREFVRDGLRAYGPPKVHILSKKIELSADSATCTLVVMSSFLSFKRGYTTLSRSEWRVSLRKIGGKWYITEVSPLELEGLSLAGLKQLGKRFMGYESGF